MLPNDYAVEYSRFLDQIFPKKLRFGELYATPNNRRYRWLNAQTIEIPTITTTGRTDANRDTVSFGTRNYANAYTPYKLNNFRKWETLLHPKLMKPGTC